MIPYEDLCSALEAYAARTRGESPSANPDITMHGERPSYGDPPTAEVALPAEPGDEHTQLGEPSPLEPVYDVASSELDLGDVDPDDGASH